MGAPCVTDASPKPWHCPYYDVLEDWQTFFAAGLGFAGLIWVARQGYAGILLSTKHADDLAKRAAELALDRDEEQRLYELRALARALAAEAAEIGVAANEFRKSLIQILDREEKVHPRTMGACVFPTTIYEANANVIGQLGDVLAPAVVALYGETKTAENLFRIASQLPDSSRLTPDAVDKTVNRLERIREMAQYRSKRLKAFADSLDKTSATPAPLASDDAAATG